MDKFHTVVIGGGCLGTASAIALANHLKQIKKKSTIYLFGRKKCAQQRTVYSSLWHC